MEEEKWVRLLSAGSTQADVIKSFLEANGIEVLLRSDVTRSVHPFSTGPLGEVDILVSEKNFQLALDLLEQIEDKQ